MNGITCYPCASRIRRVVRELRTERKCSQLSRFLDDVVAVAHCCGADDFIANSYAEAEEMRKILHRETDPAIPVGQMLAMLEERAQILRTALGDVCG